MKNVKLCTLGGDQLILTYHEVTMWLVEGFNMDLMLFDFSKAFDVVFHDILLMKLSMFGITGKLFNWIRDLLTGS